MRITVLVPTAEYKSYAGARIRYGRMSPKLAERDIELALVEVGEFDPQADNSDVLIISKCHDARSLVAAALMTARGKLVGVDLFDDYFSQTGDSRLVRYRNWLAQLLPSCSFALCSTAAMARIIRGYRRDIPIHVMNDPGPATERARLKSILPRKLAAARDCRCLKVAWFGVGDNPHFRVGLDDVAAFAGRLAGLRRSGMDVELRVLTNARALNPRGLALLANLPVRTSVTEWTEAGEQALLEEALIAFLPVSAQGFSTAKSLNRAVTALAAGCQVLSVGHPLYSAFDPLIYRNAETLVDDLRATTLRHCVERLDVYSDAMTSFASATTEAARLTEFVESLEEPRPADLPVALIHGHSTNGTAHKMVQAAHGFSIASPYCTATMGFDIIFLEAADRLAMLVSAKAAARLDAEAERRLAPAGVLTQRKFFELREAECASRDPTLQPVTEPRLPAQLASYRQVMREIARRTTNAFGPCRTIVSESSPLPFPSAA